jgi:hypothetical protein
MMVVDKRFSDDYLILSDAFIGLYTQLKDEMRGDPYNDMPPENHERFTSALRKNLPLLMSQGRSEMTIRKSWLRPIWFRS